MNDAALYIFIAILALIALHFIIRSLAIIVVIGLAVIMVINIPNNTAPAPPAPTPVPAPVQPLPQAEVPNVPKVKNAVIKEQAPPPEPQYQNTSPEEIYKGRKPLLPESRQSLVPEPSPPQSTEARPIVKQVDAIGHTVEAVPRHNINTAIIDKHILVESFFQEERNAILRCEKLKKHGFYKAFYIYLPHYKTKIADNRKLYAVVFGSACNSFSEASDKKINYARRAMIKKTKAQVQ